MNSTMTLTLIVAMTTALISATAVQCCSCLEVERYVDCQEDMQCAKLFSSKP